MYRNKKNVSFYIASWWKYYETGVFVVEHVTIDWLGEKVRKKKKDENLFTTKTKDVSNKNELEKKH